MIDGNYDECSRLSESGWRSVILKGVNDCGASSLVISKDTCLEENIVGDHSLGGVSKVVISNNPQLSVFSVGEESFNNTSLIMECRMIMN